MEALVQGLSDVGRKRPHNEDSFLSDEQLGLYVVCDGMGGHAAGEVASRRCTEILKEEVERGRKTVRPLRGDPSNPDPQTAIQLLEGAIQTASTQIYQLGLQDADKRGMGTTVAALLLAGSKAALAHVGDSRIYLIREGQVHSLTEDHTLIQAQIKAGVLTREQAESSPYRNVITRAVGIHPSVQVDTLVVDVLPGDNFLLCTDGLHNYLQERELPDLIGNAGENAAETLVRIANERGGRDNLTALLVSIVGEENLRNGDLSTASDVEAQLSAVRQMPLFRHLSYKEQMAVLAVARLGSFRAGSEILQEGAEGEELYVVVAGRVEVESGGVPLVELSSGGHFGEMGLLDNGPRSATVRALEATRCLTFSRADLMGLMRREPVLAVKLLWAFLQSLSDRLRSTNVELSVARHELEEATHPFAES